MLGDQTVGKTALAQMFVSNGQKYPQHYQMVLGAGQFEMEHYFVKLVDHWRFFRCEGSRYSRC